MPNWCFNKLKIEGSAEVLSDFIAKAYGPEQAYAPTLYDVHLAKDRPEFANKEPHEILEILMEEWRDKDADSLVNSHLSFHQLIPIPQDILAGPYDPDGFEKEQELWGCKWGASEVTVEKVGFEKANYTFNTAWSPPDNLIKTLAVEFPELRFSLRFIEPGMAFSGKTICGNGLIEVDESWPMTEDDVIELYGKDAVEDFFPSEVEE